MQRDFRRNPSADSRELMRTFPIESEGIFQFIDNRFDNLANGRDPAPVSFQRTCQNLLKLEAALWTFVSVEGVEPTNRLFHQDSSARSSLSGIFHRDADDLSGL